MQDFHPDRSFPRLHPRPPRGWLNDPNGILFADGRWHLFFQYNPDSARHDRIRWGHASSPDLLHWEQHPIALHPQEGGPDAFGCWSGVGTVDDGIPTAVYSGVTARNGQSQVLIARGSSDAMRWEQRGTIAARMPDDPGITAVRDPFLFELGGHRWALQGAGCADGTSALLLYGADDLENWEHHGFLLTAADEVSQALPASDVWECPQLVRVGDDWVLLMSLWTEAEHRGVGYLVGSLDIDADSGLPSFRARSAGIIDDGASFYAPQAVQTGDADGAGDRVLLWGWAQESTPAGIRPRGPEDCDEAGWAGMLTFPREVHVHGDAVELRPAPELDALRGEPCDPDRLPDQAEVVLTGSGPVAVRLADDDGAERTVWVGEVQEGDVFRILLDASIIEIHRQGAHSTTLRAYPEGTERYGIVAGPGVSVRAWSLRLDTDENR